jgi:hypothetical protein
LRLTTSDQRLATSYVAAVGVIRVPSTGPFMRESDRPAAAEAFDHARQTYDKIIAESDVA